MNVFFTDLDDTLFASLGKHGVDDTSPDAIAENQLHPEAFLKGGDPICYSSSRHRALRGLMERQDGLMIPVTARSVDVLGRTTIADYDFAICSNGAVLLDGEGVVDAQWQGRVTDLLRRYQPAMDAFLVANQDWSLRHDIRHWLVKEPGLGPTYYCAKSNVGRLQDLNRAADTLRESPPDWVGTIHCNGNNLALIPKGISKRDAVEDLLGRLRKRYASITTFGIGDSVTDWPFMSVCDFAITPTGSQLAGLVRQAAGSPE